MKRIFALSLVALLCNSSVATADEFVEIVTEEEAGRPDAQSSMKGSAPEEPSDGPIISFNKPTPGSEVPKPVTIDISFEKRLAPINLSTLKVTYLKLFDIDITDRVKDYASPTGIRITNAAFPAGTHKVRFELKDTENRTSQGTLKLVILDDDQEED